MVTLLLFSLYERKVDVWVLKVSAYVIATDDHLENKNMTDELYQFIQQCLQDWIEEDDVEAFFLKNVLQMLAWSAHEHTSTAEALKAFREIDEAYS